MYLLDMWGGKRACFLFFILVIFCVGPVGTNFKEHSKILQIFIELKLPLSTYPANDLLSNCFFFFFIRTVLLSVLHGALPLLCMSSTYLHVIILLCLEFKVQSICILFIFVYFEFIRISAL